MNKIKNTTLAETAKIKKTASVLFAQETKARTSNCSSAFWANPQRTKKPLSEQRSVIYSIPRTNVGRYFCAVAQNL